MSDLKLFRITNGSAQELKRKSVALEALFRRLVEANMETLFGAPLEVLQVPRRVEAIAIC